MDILCQAKSGMAQNVHTQHGLWDTFVLDFGRVLEPAVDDGPENLRLEEKVPEAAAVYRDVRALHPLLLGDGAVLRGRLGGLLGLLLLLVVQKIFINISVGHFVPLLRNLSLKV